MNKIIECVPNFSEGKDPRKVAKIAAAVQRVKGVKLLNVESDPDYNRTVITFAGEPEAVRDAAFFAIETAANVIDMTLQKGEHPRIGATDVCPFVPVANITMAECVKIAHLLGKDVGERIDIPVYLYAEAANVPQRYLLPDIRKGEYEGLSKKLSDAEWRPDYGPSIFNDRVKKTGATVIGAREFLIAYNVNLDTDDISVANTISAIIRSSGRMKLNEKGEKERVAGTLKFVQAMGVDLKEYKITQVSTNILNYKVTPPHVVFEEIKKLANVYGVNASGSEVIGLIPKGALIAAGRFYSSEENEQNLVNVAVEKLGLSQLNKFAPEKKVVEYMLGLN
ncbi:glutamate formimidoyltransferase [Candidatus Kuenenia sp.]|uniref:glutamate formimidoyltransferase n=1 Tax=Candidatus Kuenenia sp. TaxID=2499824 RepID=UPI00321F8A71